MFWLLIMRVRAMVVRLMTVDHMYTEVTA